MLFEANKTRLWLKTSPVKYLHLPDHGKLGSSYCNTQAVHKERFVWHVNKQFGDREIAQRSILSPADASELEERSPPASPAYGEATLLTAPLQLCQWPVQREIMPSRELPSSSSSTSSPKERRSFNYSWLFAHFTKNFLQNTEIKQAVFPNKASWHLTLFFLGNHSTTSETQKKNGCVHSSKRNSSVSPLFPSLLWLPCFSFQIFERAETKRVILARINSHNNRRLCKCLLRRHVL